MKRIISLIMLLVLVLSVSACMKPAPEAEPTEAPAQEAAATEEAQLPEATESQIGRASCRERVSPRV